jgi:1-acyl-sn-glycerol-3-phosphate acyltransferase
VSTESPSAEQKRCAKPSALILQNGQGKLSRIEAFNTRIIQKTFASEALNTLCRLGLVHIGARWVDICTRRLRVVHGMDRIGDVNKLQSFILATNHRSYFDLYLASMVLIKAGLRNRMIYPVRSKFFFDSPLGLIVNGIMSFGSMYPPIFRDRKRLILNRMGLQEIAWFMTHRKMCVGIHPEGTRNKTDDPYTLLPPQGGIGQLIHGCRVPIIPAFINGLSNNIGHQVVSNFTGKGQPINLVFGAPLDFSEYYDQTGRIPQKKIAKDTWDAIHALGQEEKLIREAQSSKEAS